MWLSDSCAGSFSVLEVCCLSDSEFDSVSGSCSVPGSELDPVPVFPSVPGCTGEVGLR